MRSRDSGYFPLCPKCGALEITINAASTVFCNVVFDPILEDLLVIDEKLGDAEWDTTSIAECKVCSWQGSVADIDREDS